MNNNDQNFNIAFVSVVKQYEELYNYNLEKYSNRRSQEIAWENIADQVKSTATECKKRWRHLRVSFLRSLRERKKPPGSSGKQTKPHYLEDAMKFLIPFAKSRCQKTVNVECDDERVKTESYWQVSDSELSTNENDSMHNSDDTQNTQAKQEECMDTTIQERQAQSSATNKVEAQLPSKSTDLNTRRNFQEKYLKTKQPSTGSREHAAVQCTKYKRKTNEPSDDQEDSDLLFLKSLLPDMKKLDDVQKRRYKQRILALYDEIIDNEQYVPIPVYSSAMSNYSSGSSTSSHFNNNQARNIDPLCASLVSADAVNSDNDHE